MGQCLTTKKDVPYEPERVKTAGEDSAPGREGAGSLTDNGTTGGDHVRESGRPPVADPVAVPDRESVPAVTGTATAGHIGKLPGRTVDSVAAPTDGGPVPAVPATAAATGTSAGTGTAVASATTAQRTGQLQSREYIDDGQHHAVSIKNVNISGDLVVNGLVRAYPVTDYGIVDPRNVEVEFIWMRLDGQGRINQIEGATMSTYVLQRDDVGCNIVCKARARHRDARLNVTEAPWAMGRSATSVVDS